MINPTREAYKDVEEFIFGDKAIVKWWFYDGQEVTIDERTQELPEMLDENEDITPAIILEYGCWLIFKDGIIKRWIDSRNLFKVK